MVRRRPSLESAGASCTITTAPVPGFLGGGRWGWRARPPLLPPAHEYKAILAPFAAMCCQLALVINRIKFVGSTAEGVRRRGAAHSATQTLEAPASVIRQRKQALKRRDRR
jgi:hypothetical protein